MSDDDAGPPPFGRVEWVGEVHPENVRPGDSINGVIWDAESESWAQLDEALAKVIPLEVAITEHDVVVVDPIQRGRAAAAGEDAYLAISYRGRPVGDLVDDLARSGRGIRFDPTTDQGRVLYRELVARGVKVEVPADNITAHVAATSPAKLWGEAQAAHPDDRAARRQLYIELMTEAGNIIQAEPRPVVDSHRLCDDAVEEWNGPTPEFGPGHEHPAVAPFFDELERQLMFAVENDQRRLDDRRAKWIDAAAGAAFMVIATRPGSWRRIIAGTLIGSGLSAWAARLRAR